MEKRENIRFKSLQRRKLPKSFNPFDKSIPSLFFSLLFSSSLSIRHSSQLESCGLIEQRLNIQAQEDVYSMTKSKVTEFQKNEELNKKQFVISGHSSIHPLRLLCLERKRSEKVPRRSWRRRLSSLIHLLFERLIKVSISNEQSNPPNNNNNNIRVPPDRHRPFSNDPSGQISFFYQCEDDLCL